MNPKLYRAIQSGNWDDIKEFADQFSSAKTPTGNTILHVLAQSCDSSDVARQILAREPNLALTGNELCETPLHIAARRGHCSVVQALVEFTKEIERIKELLTGTNKCGNTALHEAVRNNCSNAVKLLVEVAPECQYWENFDGASPLFLAVDNGNHEIVALILSTCEPLYYLGPGKKTALHIAAARNFPECIEMILEKLPDLIKEVDESGWTALHYAAKFNHKEVVKQLLTKDKSMAYVPARKDDLKIALHVAVIHGNVDVVKEILLQCPDCWEMATGNIHNILHLAVKNEQKEVLEFLLQNCWAPELVNLKDKDGNTPLHLYVATNCLDGYKLVNQSYVDRNALNSAGMTPLDIIAKEAKKATDRQRSIKRQLVKAGATPGIGVVQTTKDEAETRSGETGIDDVRTAPDRANEERDDEATMDTCRLIATLIITVTFAAGFTVPGGYDNSKGNEGMAVLSKKSAFSAFVVSDSLALMFSITAVLSQLLAKESRPVSPGSLRNIKLYIAAAMCCMVIAFLCGLYAMLSTRAVKTFLLVLFSFVCSSIWVNYFVVIHRGVLRIRNRH